MSERKGYEDEVHNLSVGQICLYLLPRLGVASELRYSETFYGSTIIFGVLQLHGRLNSSTCQVLLICDRHNESF